MSEQKDVPTYTVDGIIERFDRINRRLIAVIVLLSILLVGSYIAFFVYESQFDFVSSETDTDIEAIQLGGQTNLVSGGDMYYGAEGENQNND